MKLRKRDFIASILSLILSNQLYRYNHASSESLSTSINLEFYTHFTSHYSYGQTEKKGEEKWKQESKESNESKEELNDCHDTGNNVDHGDHDDDVDITHATSIRRSQKVATPVLFDINGDGMNDALIAPSLSSNMNNDDNEWIINILDLKPLHSKQNGNQKQKQQLLASSKPLHPKTIFQYRNENIPIQIITGQIYVNENDFIAKKYPIDIDDLVKINTNNDKNNNGRLLPSIVTVWNNGNVTLHCICRKGNKDDFELRELWNMNPFIYHDIISVKEEKSSTTSSSDRTTHNYIHFDEIDLILNNGQQGAVIVMAATIYYSFSFTFYCQIDALTGNIIWIQQSVLNENKLNQHQNINESSTSSISIQSDLHQGDNSGTNITQDNIQSMPHIMNDTHTNVQDCHEYFGKHLYNPSMNVLPHMYHDSTDAKIILTHYDENHKRSKSIKKKNSQRKSMFISDTLMLMEEKNVIVFHNRKGVHVLSYEDGYQLCHLPCHHPNHVYADINKDGIIDEIHLITKGKEKKQQKHTCHATLKTNIRAGRYNQKKEEIFQVNLCSSLIRSYKRKNGNVDDEMLFKLGTSFAMPLLVESFDNKNYGMYTEDIIFALNHGSIQRYDSSGTLQWSSSKPYQDVPTWDGNTKDVYHEFGINGFIGRIDFKQALKDSLFVVRPILIVGDNKMTILSAFKGKVLASMTFPQLAVAKPILADMNGDGTTDVLIITNDGIWGYSLKINGRSFIGRIAMVVLLVGFAIALIMHKFSTDSGNSRRATDS